MLEVDRVLMRLGNELCRVVTNPVIGEKLVASAAAWQCPAAVWPDREGKGEIRGLRAAEMVARRPWLDFVAPEEYFFPCRQLYTRESEPAIEEFDCFSNPKLATLGDHITRHLFLRIKFWREHLERLLGQCVFAVGGHDNADLLSGVVRLQAELGERVSRLSQLCLAEPEFRLRDNCFVLTQIYNSYAPVPRLDWLNLPDDVISANRCLARLAIRRPTCDLLAIQRVVAALSGLADLYRNAACGELRLTDAIRAKKLVLVDSPRTVYWNGKGINVNWERKNKAVGTLMGVSLKSKTRNACRSREPKQPGV